MNDSPTASNPIPENFDRKLISRAQDRMATMALGINKSSLLDPVVSGVSLMKLIMATKTEEHNKQLEQTSWAVCWISNNFLTFVCNQQPKK